MKKFLKEEVEGFAGTTHVLIAILFLFLLVLFPTPFTQGYLKTITSDYLFFSVIFFTIAGASLLPDLDNNESTAKYHTGIFGELLTITMKITSSLAVSFTTMENDKKPKTQHRYLWHTIFISVCIMALLWFGIPSIGKSYLEIMKEQYSSGGWQEIVVYNVDHSSLFLGVVFSLISLNMGFNVVTWRLFKIVPWMIIKKWGPHLIQLGYIFLLLNMPLSRLEFVGLSVGIGYLFHNLGDLFSLGSIPLIWPIPAFWKKQWWWKPYMPFQLYTGGIANKILDVVLLFIDLLLFWKIFFN